ncbi:hypothetical protein Celaphus_00009811, partial [Cervus elaphus hippelaphus]
MKTSRMNQVKEIRMNGSKWAPELVYSVPHDTHGPGNSGGKIVCLGLRIIKTKQEVEISQRVTLKKLPPVLMLHLKQFVYQKTVVYHHECSTTGDHYTTDIPDRSECLAVHQGPLGR